MSQYIIPDHSIMLANVTISNSLNTWAPHTELANVAMSNRLVMYLVS